MTIQERLGKAAMRGAHPEIQWDLLMEETKAVWIAAAEAAVSASKTPWEMLCADHLNEAERGIAEPFEKCIACIREDVKAHLNTILAKQIEIQGLMHDLKIHREAVGQFLSDMRCTMIDPLAEGVSSVKETCEVLLKAATEQRQREHDLRTALHEVREVIEKSEHWWMDSPDKGGFDTEKIDVALGIAKSGGTDVLHEV